VGLTRARRPRTHRLRRSDGHATHARPVAHSPRPQQRDAAPRSPGAATGRCHAVVCTLPVASPPLPPHTDTANSAEMAPAVRLEQAIIDSVADAIITTDGRGQIETWNPGAEAIFGYQTNEVVGRDIRVLMPPAMARRHEVFLGARRASPTSRRREGVGVHRDGTAIPIDVHMRAASFDGRQIFVIILRDLRERKEAETRLAHEIADRQRLELELRLAQKLQAVGQLAAGVAHEINTPIQYVSDSVDFLRSAVTDLRTLLTGCIALCQRWSGPDREQILDELVGLELAADLAYLDEQVPGAFERVADGTAHVTRIVRARRELAHPCRPTMEAVDLNRALETTLTIAHNEYRYVADIETQLGELPPVICHLSDLNQVFLNLVVNAAHAIETAGPPSARGKITVSSAVDGDNVLITIADTGSGITPEIRDRVFDPFFTTKEVGKGSGQGLAISRNIVVNKHAGSLWFETEVGRGTTFYILLPIQGGAPAEAPSPG